jgi:hypothetical protein
MAKTVFVSGTKVLSTWLNSVFGSGASGGHVHDGGDADGHAPKISLSDAANVSGQLPVANLVQLTSSNITNSSDVSGATVTAAANTLAGLISALTTSLSTLNTAVSALGTYVSIGLLDSDIALYGATGTVSVKSALYLLQGNMIHLDIVFTVVLSTGTLTQIQITLPSGLVCKARYVGYFGGSFFAINSIMDDNILNGAQGMACPANFLAENNILRIDRPVTAKGAKVSFLFDDYSSSMAKFSVQIAYEKA